MNCKVCGSIEFVTNEGDGITYCSECHSQVEEIAQTEVAVEPVLSRDIYSSPAPKKTSVEKKKEYNDWITVECYNHIIYMQVSSLIKLGASPKLKHTVLRVWSTYLQKCEIAFRTDYQASDGKPHLGPAALKRDINVLYGNKQIPRRKRKNSEISASEISVSEASINEAMIYDTESETESVMTVASDVSCEKKKYSSHARKLFRKSGIKKSTKHTYMKKVFNMTLSKTLSFCYLGLLYTEDQLSLCDLIRFVYEEKVPFVNMLDKLPSSMKLQIGDQVTFLAYSVPDAYSILKTSRQIAKFAKLPEFKEPCVFLAASRFVRDLNLPGDILPVVKTLVEKYKEQLLNWKNAPNLENVPHEYRALASIVVAMKMLFILDDRFEIEHSKVMSKLNAVYPDHKYFEWKEWKKQSVIKEYLFLSEKPGNAVVNKLDGLSADRILSKYSFTRLKSSNDIQNSHSRDIVSAKINIMNQLSDIVTIPNRCHSIPTSFPLRSAVNCFMEEWRNLPMFKETQNIDFTLLTKDFSSCSLSFNPSQFDKEDEELSYLLMTTLYLPEISVSLGSKYSQPITYHHEVIKTTSKYWFLNPENCGISNITSDWFDKLPNSFKWLINFVSKYTYCNKFVLYKEVAQMEKILFLQKRNIGPRDLAKHKFSDKINVDF